MRSPRRSVRRAPGRDGVRPPARGEGSRAEFGSHAGREPESWRPQVPRHPPPPQPPTLLLVPPRTGRHSNFRGGDIFSSVLSPQHTYLPRVLPLTDVRRDRVDCRAASRRRPRASAPPSSPASSSIGAERRPLVVSIIRVGRSRSTGWRRAPRLVDRVATMASSGAGVPAAYRTGDAEKPAPPRGLRRRHHRRHERSRVRARQGVSRARRQVRPGRSAARVDAAVAALRAEFPGACVAGGDATRHGPRATSTPSATTPHPRRMRAPLAQQRRDGVVEELLDVEPAEVVRVCNTNLTGAILCCQKAVRLMRRQDEGSAGGSRRAGISTDLTLRSDTTCTTSVQPVGRLFQQVHVHAQGDQARFILADGIAQRGPRGGGLRRRPSAVARHGAHRLAPRRRVAGGQKVLQRPRRGTGGGGGGPVPEDPRNGRDTNRDRVSDAPGRVGPV